MNNENFTRVLAGSLYKFLQERNKNKDEYYNTAGIHVSQLDNCVRAVVMERFNFPKKELTLAELLMFEISNFVHRLILEWACNTDDFKFCGGERDLSEGLPDGISGKCDIIIEDKKTGLRILLDTKTAMPTAFKTYMDYLVKEAHILQGNAYKLALENLGEAVDLIIFTYFDRGGTNSPVYAVIPEVPEFVLENKFDLYKRAIEEYEKSKTLPPKEPPIFENKGNDILVKKSWKCDYCPYCNISCEGWKELDRKKAVKLDKDNPEIMVAYEKFIKENPLF